MDNFYLSGIIDNRILKCSQSEIELGNPICLLVLYRNSFKSNERIDTFLLLM